MKDTFDETFEAASSSEQSLKVVLDTWLVFTENTRNPDLFIVALIFWNIFEFYILKDSFLG